MSDLTAKLDNLSLGEDRSKMFGYIWRTKQKKNYFDCKNNYFVVPDIRGSTLVLIRKVKKNDAEGYICLKCTDMTVFKNLGNIKNFEGLKQEYYDHARVCPVLFDKVGVSPNQTQDKNEVEVLKSSLQNPAINYK